MRLTESDSMFLYGENATGPLQTAGVFILKGELPFDRYYEYMAARVHLVERFRQRLAWVPLNLAHPKWVDDPEFDLTNHVVHHTVPDGTDLLDAIDVAVGLNEGLMERDRPLWKFTLISGVPDRTLILQQVHHAMIDGASAVHLSTILLDFQPDAPAPPAPEEPWNPPPVPSSFELATEAMRENATSMAQQNPLRVLQRDAESRELIGRGTQAMSRFLTRPAIMAPWNAGLLSAKRRMRWSVHPFSEFKEIRRAFGGTVNDVVLTAVTEGAARYLAQHDEETRDQYLRLMCPVNVRTEDEAGALGNRVSAMMPMFPAWPMDPVERLVRIREETERIKSAQEPQAMTLMQESGFSGPPVAMAPLQLVGTPFDPSAWMASNPPPVLPRMGPRPPFFGINFVCTNVPGVQVPQYIAGHELLEQTAIMMMAGTMGYGIAVVSYNQKMILNFTCEPRLLPDLELMVELNQSAFEELLAAARTKNSDAA